MKGIDKNRKLVPFRLSKVDYDKCKIKLTEDHLTFQKVMEVLFHAYMKNNKHVMEIVLKYANEQQDKKRRYELNDLEIHEIRNIIEQQHTPLRFLEEISDEVKGNEK